MTASSLERSDLISSRGRCGATRSRAQVHTPTLRLRYPPESRRVTGPSTEQPPRSIARCSVPPVSVGRMTWAKTTTTAGTSRNQWTALTRVAATVANILSRCRW